MSAPAQSPDTALTDRITLELRRLCIPGCLRGFKYLAYMLAQAVPDQNRLVLITKNLYPDTGRSFGVSAASLERAVRTAISSGWKRGGRSVLEEMACCSLSTRPTASQFLDIVADYIRRTR